MCRKWLSFNGCFSASVGTRLATIQSHRHSSFVHITHQSHLDNKLPSVSKVHTCTLKNHSSTPPHTQSLCLSRRQSNTSCHTVRYAPLVGLSQSQTASRTSHKHTTPHSSSPCDLVSHSRGRQKIDEMTQVSKLEIFQFCCCANNTWPLATSPNLNQTIWLMFS